MSEHVHWDIVAVDPRISSRTAHELADEALVKHVACAIGLSMGVPCEIVLRHLTDERGFFEQLVDGIREDEVTE